MSQKFRNTYRIPSARLPNWDYGANAAYFITICTGGKEYYFGEIREGVMQLNEIGNIAQKYWDEIPQHFDFVELGAFVVMPNHVHGIVIINKTHVETTDSGVSKHMQNNMNQTPKLGVSTVTNKQGGKNDGWKSGTIGVIVNQYKRKCTIESRKIHADFAWQSRFHDHIIRTNNSYQKIENYIQNNPAQWAADTFYRRE